MVNARVPPTAASTKLPAGLAACGILAIAFGLRWPELNGSLWLDELHTAWCVGGTWDELAPRCQIGNQSPLYFRGLWFVVQIFGASERLLRAPSLLAGLGLVVVVGTATYRWSRSIFAGLLAAFLAAIDRNGIFYSQEARPYAVLQLVAWTHVLIAWRLVERPTLALRSCFIGGAILQFYLHYTAGLFLAAEIALLATWPGGKYGRRRLLNDLIAILLASLPTGWHLLEIASRREAWQQFVSAPNAIESIRLARLDVYGVVPLLFLFSFASLHWKHDAKWAVPADRSGPWRQLGAAGGLWLLPTLLAWLSTRGNLAALFLGRYLVSSLAAGPIVAVLLIRRIPGRLGGILAAVAVVAASLATSGMWEQWQRDGRLLGDRRQDWRSAVKFINQRAVAGSSLCLVRSGFVEADRLQSETNRLLTEYCLAPVTSLYRLQIPAVPLPTRIAAPADGWDTIWRPRAREPVREVWLLINGSERTRQTMLAQWSATMRRRIHGVSLEHVVSFGDILVCQFHWDQPTSPRSIPAP